MNEILVNIKNEKYSQIIISYTDNLGKRLFIRFYSWNVDLYFDLFKLHKPSVLAFFIEWLKFNEWVDGKYKFKTTNKNV